MDMDDGHGGERLSQDPGSTIHSSAHRHVKIVSNCSDYLSVLTKLVQICLYNLFFLFSVQL